MVLQREHAIPIWGWARPGETITVRLHRQERMAKADRFGCWKLVLPAEKAGGPYDLVVTGRTSKTLHNVLIGDVWFCSGQSNMEFAVKDGWHAADEIKESEYPLIRQCKIPHRVAVSPRQDIDSGVWQTAGPASVGGFTAVGYFFARAIGSQLHIPIGLINCSWGGTHCETWTSREGFENSDEFREMIRSIPVMDLDSLQSQRRRATRQRIRQLQGSPEHPEKESGRWKDLDFDDNNWPALTLPGLWEQQAPGDLDGVVWFRKTVELTVADIAQPSILSLGTVDDNDQTYINGIRVGETKGYNIKRSYTVPQGILKAGRNLIAIRIEDNGGGGGVYGNSSGLWLKTGETTRSLAGSWSYQVQSIYASSSRPGPNDYPTLLWNGMISPLVSFPIKGFLWYQGEANTGRAWQYRKAFPLLITDWRRHWKMGDLPFYFVQLASFNANNGNSNNGSTWAELREAQALTQSLPNTGMAVTTDIGEPDDIHPKNKQEVGRRLAALALHRTYGVDVQDGGPLWQATAIHSDSLCLSFANARKGLAVKDSSGTLKGFELAGDDHVFYPARASISGSQVILFAPDVRQPIAARYGWSDDAGAANLYNQEGFPASPFRTDNWKLTTEAIKYKPGSP